MKVTKRIQVDLQQPTLHPVVYAMQNDSNTREVEIALFSGGVAWEVPADSTLAIAFKKQDGTSGLYDRLPNGDLAHNVSDNLVAIVLAPEVLTVQGIVDVAVVFYDNNLNQLATFPFSVAVTENPSAGQSVSNNYYNFSTLADINEALENSVVRVDVEQTFSAQQQARARNNIGAIGDGDSIGGLEFIHRLHVDREADIDFHDNPVKGVAAGEADTDAVNKKQLEDAIAFVGGGSAEGAVLYTEQDLTPEQQAQARENIGAVGADDIFEKKYSPNLLDLSAITENAFILDGKLYTGASYANYVTTDFIPCKAGDVIRHQFTYYSTGIYTRYDNAEVPSYCKMNSISGFDENGNFVSGSQQRSVTTYTVPDGVVSIRISFIAAHLQDKFSDNAIIIQDDATVIPYEPYGVTFMPTLKPEMLPPDPKLLAFLPDEICVAVGRTIEIYNSQVCPLADKYHFRWVCNVGKALKRKFSITGTDGLVGNYDLTLEIYDDAEKVVYSKTSTLRIVAQLSADVSICTIGDSLTNNKYWLNEVQTLSENKVSFVGTRGTVDGRKHEGRSGFTSGQYLKATSYTYENEGVHPFWDGSAFNWGYYKTNTGINPSAVQLFLGTNDLFGSVTAETLAENIKTMVDSIRENDANIPLFVVMTILPGDQNGIGVQQSNDGFASQKGKFKFGLDCKFVKAMQMLHDTLKGYANLYFVPLAECHDSEYNFGAVETPVNPRASQKELMPTEGVHPKQQGYEQIADIMYSVICAKLGTE